MPQLPYSPELTPSRYRELTSHDPARLTDCLASTAVVTIAYSREDAPVQLPTAFGFDNDFIYVHASTGSHFAREMSDGRELMLTVFSLDGFVYARTGYDSAVHYRSAVIRGRAEVCEGDEKLAALRLITEHLLPGRWDELPAPTNKELAATMVMRIPLDRVSLKILDGGVDESAGVTDPEMWAGVVPVRMVAGIPETSAGTKSGVAAAASTALQRTRFS